MEISLYQVKLSHFVPTVFGIKDVGQRLLQYQVHNRLLQVSWWIVSIMDQGVGVTWSMMDTTQSL